MRPLRTLVIYLGAVFIGGALLAPWLYRLAQMFSAAFPHVAGSPFQRFADRSLTLVALAGLWPLLRGLGATSWRETGVVDLHGQWKKFFGGLLLGGLTLAIVAGGALKSSHRAWIPDLAAHTVVGTIFSATALAIVIAIVEEILFRGGIFGGLRRLLYWPIALMASSAVYALVHFLQPAEFSGPVTWNSGLALLPRMLGGFADFHALVPGFFTLLLMGALLGLAYQRTGNLYFSIGLHAGWIFWLRTYSTFTTGTASGATWFWGTGNLIDGWSTLIVLAVTLAIFKHLPLQPAREPYAISG